MMCENRWNGFTLLELVLTIVIFALVGIMAVSFFNKGVTRSDIPISQLQADASLQLVLENMIQDANASGLGAINANVGTVGSSSTFYGNNTSHYISYYVANKMYVCPDSTNTFVKSINTNQFLLVTIKPSATSGVSLSYIFGSTNNTVNACGD